MGMFDFLSPIFGGKGEAGLLGLGSYDPNTGAYKNPKEEEERAQLAEQLRIAQGQAPSQFQGGQVQLAQQLQQQAAGQGPSVANQQLVEGTNRGLAQQLAMAAQNRNNPAMAQRVAAQNQANISAQGAQNAAQLRNQEILQARGQLAGVLQQGRQGDATENSVNNQNQQFYTQAGLNLNSEAMKGQMSLDEQRNKAFADQIAQRGRIMQAAGQAGAAALTASDEKLKTNIKDGSEEIKSFLDALTEKAYKYKKGIGEDDKEHFSPMAQDLEKSKVGESMVIDTPKGKMVDYGKGYGAVLASLAEINKRMKALEGK